MSVRGFGYGAAAMLAITAGAMAARTAWVEPAQVRVVDGDTMVVDGERIRLNGIDAPELPGHCREGRRCVEGDGFGSTASLMLAVNEPGKLQVDRLDTDRYGRTIAQVRRGDIDLSCWQIGHGAAQYVARWDEQGRTKAACQ